MCARSRRDVIRSVCLAAGSLAAVIGAPRLARAETASTAAARLAEILDLTDVEHKWIAGQHVAWETGLPDGRSEITPGRHTHCSAFVASVAKRLGIYILRPPQHGQLLLANAQNEWLASDEGAKVGWRRLPGAAEAQDAANRGDLVVASYHNHHDDKPGHIAIVRPSGKSAALLATEGPDIIQAGTINHRLTSVKQGFSGHPAGWKNNEIVYYAHEIRRLLQL